MRIDFRKLDNAALRKYVDHYQLAVQAGLSNDELAVVVRVVLYVSSIFFDCFASLRSCIR